MMSIPDPAQLKIVFYPDPVLKKTCAPVESFDDKLSELVERMWVLMKEANGVGLAAPQVGLPLRLFVFNVTGESKDNHVCVNPEFVELEGAESEEEGCLSLPGIHVSMRRAQKVVLRAQNLDGEWLEMRGENLPARVWQHESDHLDGKLIIDNMSPSDEIASRKALKQLTADYKAGKR